jgi:hypothetical protein
MIDLTHLLYQRAGLCDQCVAKIDANPEVPLEDLLDDKCLAKLNAWMRGMHEEES